jgi:aconitate hydratase
VQEADTIDLIGIETIAPGSLVKGRFHHEDGSVSEIELVHSLNAEQIDWFKAGSALNFLKG